MAKRKRAPIEQLRAAGKTAREMLVAKGIIAEKSVIDEIIKKEGAPRLPGIPPYLPHQSTIKAAQRIMFDLVIMWKEESKNDIKRQNNITEFFKFVVGELKKKEEEYNEEMKKVPKLFKLIDNVPVMKEVFSSLRKKENTQAMHHFFVDSFAVAIVIKTKLDTVDYVEWFIDWTEDMYKLWLTQPENLKEEKIKI